MRLELTRSGQGALLVAGGRLTASVAGRLRDGLLEAFAGANRVELVLREVEEADLTFLQVLCAAHRTAAARSAALAVTGLHEARAVARLIRESGATSFAGCPPAAPDALHPALPRE